MSKKMENHKKELLAGKTIMLSSTSYMTKLIEYIGDDMANRLDFAGRGCWLATYPKVEMWER